MRRSMLWMLVAPVVGCTGYERPVVRNLDAVGAPAVQQEAEGQAVPKLAELADTHGRVEKRTFDALSILADDGESVMLNLGSRTRVILDGRVVNVWAVPEGAEVRASWDAAASPPVAEQIEVLDLRPD